MTQRILSHSDLLQLKRWNTPTIYNGWEMITQFERTDGFVNLEATTDFSPELGPMIGYAVTLTIEPSNPKHAENRNAWAEYRAYMASIPGPKIVVVQDLDKPHIGSIWGEVNANVHRAFGCVGTITDGCVRDLDEMKNAGFKPIAKRLCVGHAYATPVSWGGSVEVFGVRVKPGALIHADKHGFIIIPPEDQPGLLEAAQFMDQNELKTLIDVARSSSGISTEELLDQVNEAGKRFGKAARQKFSSKGER